LGFSTPERLYFQTLIQYENASTPEEKDLCRLWMSEANPGGEYRVREIDEYAAIAHWVHMALLGMTDIPGFKGTAEDAHARLGGKVSIAEIRSAIERLKALDIVRREEGGRLVRTANRFTTRDDVANRGARECHKQVARLGIDAIDEQDVSIREFQTFAMAIPLSKVGLAKEMIRRFRTQLADALTGEGGAEEVYQAQIQFFRLTESPSEMVQKEDEGAGRNDPDPGSSQ
jgi:uncharacterized protein (TIGR02147 family)